MTRFAKSPLNSTGLALFSSGALNPVAAAAELGISSESHAMSTVINYQALKKDLRVLALRL